MTATENATSPNFGFLAKRYPELEQIAARSERYFSDDLIVSLNTHSPVYYRPKRPTSDRDLGSVVDFTANPSEHDQ